MDGRTIMTAPIATRFLRYVCLSALMATSAAAESTAAESTTFQARQPDGSSLKISGLLAKPQGNGPFPAVVLLHTCGGVRSHVSRHWPAFLVEQGYVTLTVDSFGSRGLGRCPNRLVGPRADVPFASRMKILLSDANGALDHLAGLPYVRKDSVAVAGYSLGGTTIHFALMTSDVRTPGGNRFAAAASFYGPRAIHPPTRPVINMARLNRSPLPLLEVIGDKDERIARDCKDLLPKDGSVELHILPGVYHAFDSPEITSMRHDFAGHPMLYDADAAKKARGLLIDFLKRHSGG